MSKSTYKAFQGANGWYVAAEKNGTHRQPPSNGSLTRAEAQRQARNLNSDWCPHCGGNHNAEGGTPGYSCESAR